MSEMGKILLVEDEAGIRQTLARILQSAGCQVDVFELGQDALESLAGSVYDLVYLDIHLPDMNGIELLAKILQVQPDLPVVLFTGNATLQSAISAMRAGAVDYLLKPINPENLISRTRVILAEQSRLQRIKEIRAQMNQLREELHHLEGVENQGPDRELNKALLSPFAGSAMGLPGVPPEARFLNRGELVLDLQTRTVTLGERVINLPPTSFDYLVALARHMPAVVSYQILVQEAQGYTVNRREAIELNKWHIHVLREVLEPDPKNPQYVQNVRGIGYRLELD